MPVDELTCAHEALAIDLDRLHLLAAAAEGTLPAPRMRAVVIREVLDLCAVLEQHFAAEEAAVARSTAAHRDAVLDKLRAEHCRLLEGMHGLAEVARTVPMDVLRLRISDALGALADHERDESRYTPRQPT